MADNTSPKALYDSFLAKFPLESLETMPLEVYTNTNHDSFCYWLDRLQTDLAAYGAEVRINLVYISVRIFRLA